MGYSHILSSKASLATFRATYNILEDVDIAYCHEGNIDIQRRRGVNTVFFPLMAILEGGIRFPVDPLVIGTLRFYSLCPDQFPHNFYRVVSCVSRLNQLFSLHLDYHDINYVPVYIQLNVAFTFCVFRPFFFLCVNNNIT